MQDDRDLLPEVVLFVPFFYFFIFIIVAEFKTIGKPTLEWAWRKIFLDLSLVWCCSLTILSVICYFWLRDCLQVSLFRGIQNLLEIWLYSQMFLNDMNTFLDLSCLLCQSGYGLHLYTCITVKLFSSYNIHGLFL